jgi:hypothetical protein
MFLGALAPAVAAQTSRGTVTGVVTDQNGAVVSGAAISLLQKDTNQTRTATSNDAGLYRFDAVDLGTYDLTISATGFQSYTVKDISIQANRIATFDASLQVGTAGVVVEVNAGSDEILQKSDAVRGGNFEHREIAKLPLTGLNAYNLAALLPGVSAPTGSGASFGNASQFSVNGARPRGNNYLLDGVENNDISVTGPALVPNNEDSVGEVSVQTGLFSAEFGRAGGGVFNQVIRGGTNEFHGTARWLYISQVFNALTQGQRNSGLDEPPVFTENIFSGTFGGPIIKERTFFFGGILADRFRSTTNFGPFTVPTAAGLARLRQLFPEGSNERVDLYLQAFTGLTGLTNPTLIPLGRGPDGVDRGSIEFGRIGISAPSTTDAEQYVLRLDHLLNDDNRLAFRYLYDTSLTDKAALFNPGFTRDFVGDSHNFLATHTWVLSPTTTNEFRFSFGRISFDFPISPDAVELASTLPRIDISGISGFGVATNIPQFRIANNYLFQETMSKVVSTHTLRFGGEYLFQDARQRPPFNERGSFGFNPGGGFTGFANFIDNFSGASGAANINFGEPVYEPDLNRISLFFQDTWKMTPTFTLTLGLRYENFGQPANSAFQFPAFAGFDPENFLTPNKVNRDDNNFGPIIGFAWAPNFSSGLRGAMFGEDKTVIRGGYQISYDTFFNNMLSNIAADSPNVVSTTTVGGAGRGLTGFFPNAIPTTPRTVTPLDSQTSVFDPNIRNPYLQRYSLGIQRDLPWNMLVDVSYVGSLGRKLFISEDLNPFVAAPNIRRFPNLGIRRIRANGANSSYNSLQMRLDKGFSRGFQVNASYTYSKLIDNISEIFATDSSNTSLASVPVFQGGLALDRAVSDYDRRHRFAVGYFWELPGPRSGILGHVIGGWQTSGIVELQSGAPFTILNGLDRNADGVSGGDRPDVGNPNAPRNTRAVIVPLATCSTGFRNPDTNACVTPNDVYVVQGLGFPNERTLGRNTERSGPVENVNMTLFKVFRLTERFSLEYRAEFFNVFNHPQVTGVPARSVVASPANEFMDFGLLSGGGRTGRMGLKLIF